MMEYTTEIPVETLSTWPCGPSDMEALGCDEYIRLSTPDEINEAYEFGRLTWGVQLFPPYM